MIGLGDERALRAKYMCYLTHKLCIISVLQKQFLVMRNNDNVIHAEIPKNEICALFQISSSLELMHPVNSNNETWATSYVL